jgi:hypothetical protein
MQQRVREQLQDGEQLVWVSQPDQRAIIYAVTDRRVITIEGSKQVIVQSYLPEDLSHPERIDYDDGRGDIILRKQYGRDAAGNGIVTRFGLFAISNARWVEALVEKLICTHRLAVVPDSNRYKSMRPMLAYSE